MSAPKTNFRHKGKPGKVDVIDDLRAERDELRGEVDTLRKSRKVVDEELEKYGQICGPLQRENAELRAEVEQQAQIIGRSIDDHDKIVMEKRGVECERNKLRAKVERLEEENRRLKRAKEKHLGQIMERTTREIDLLNKLEAIKKCWNEGLDPFDDGKKDTNEMENMWFKKMDDLL